MKIIEIKGQTMWARFPWFLKTFVIIVNTDTKPLQTQQVEKLIKVNTSLQAYLLLIIVYIGSF